jgi:hypothetical protein
MKKLQFVLFALLTGILAMSVLQTGIVQAKTKKTFILDVACDGRTAVVNQVDPDATTPFLRGDVAVVNGNIYPGDTIPAGFNGTFNPDAVTGIGTWRCLFASLDEPPLSGAVTYYFSLDQNSEESMIMVQGLNSHRGPASVPRILAIVGGTGKYVGAAGEVHEEVIGTNTTGCFNFRYHIRLKKQAPK